MKPIIRFKLQLAVGGACLSAGLLLTQAAPPADGSAVYKQRCVMCHKSDGKGFPALKTPDFTDPKWQASKKDAELAEVIKSGKKGTPMPAFAEKLKDDEIAAVVAFVRSFSSAKK